MDQFGMETLKHVGSGRSYRHKDTCTTSFHSLF